MTLGENLLPKFDGLKANGGNRFTFDDPTGHWTITAEVETRDLLGCRLSSLTVRRRTAPRDTRAWAESIVQRTHSLSEPLVLLEFDAQRDEALIRSERPTVRLGERGHFELRLREGSLAHLMRYTAPLDATAKRRPTTFDLTHDALAKLVDDLTTE